MDSSLVNGKLIFASWLASSFYRIPNLCCVLMRLVCYNGNSMPNRFEQEPPNPWNTKNPLARDLIRREQERRGFKGVGVAAHETLCGLLAEELGLFPSPPEPPPGFLEKPDVIKDGLEINYNLTPEERTYLAKMVKHEAELRQYVKQVFRLG